MVVSTPNSHLGRHVFGAATLATVRRSAWASLIGCLAAALGAILYTQLGRLVDPRFNGMVLNVAVLTSYVATLGGSLTALVASVIWARKAVTQYVLRAAVSIVAVTFLIGLLVNVNIHGPSAMLILLMPLAILDSLLLFCIFVGREASS
jgi:Ca2+/Na+ antiporter